MTISINTAYIKPLSKRLFTVKEYYKMAEAGIEEYWIVNITEQQIEVFSQPANGDYQAKNLGTVRK